MNLQHFFIHYVPDVQKATVEHDAVLDVNCLKLLPSDCNIPFSAEFDEVMKSLNAMAESHCEGDGAFGWNSAGNESSRDAISRVGGTLHAIENKILFVEAFGTFTPDDWAAFLKILNAGESAVVQLAERGCFISSAEFRRLLSRQ